MSDLKHTPGPWKIIEAGNSLGVIPAKRPPGITARDVEDIASLSLDNEQSDSRANARLIAAAPDLLAACVKSLALLTAVEVSPGLTAAHHAAVVEAVKAAMAKATG